MLESSRTPHKIRGITLTHRSFPVFLRRAALSTGLLKNVAGLGTPSIRMLRLGRYTHPCPASFPTALQNFLDCNPLSISTLYRYLFPEHFLSRFRPSSRPSPLAFVFAFLFVIP